MAPVVALFLSQSGHGPPPTSGLHCIGQQSTFRHVVDAPQLADSGLVPPFTSWPSLATNVVYSTVLMVPSGAILSFVLPLRHSLLHPVIPNPLCRCNWVSHSPKRLT